MERNVVIAFMFCLAMAFSGCTRVSDKVVGDFTYTFPAEKWMRFNEEAGDVVANYIVHEFEVADTASAYTITLDFRYTPRISEMSIPIVFSVFSPDGEESHVRTTLLITDKNKGVVSKVIYPVKYFKTPGTYKIQFFQKTTKMLIDGAVSTNVKVKVTGK